MLIDAVPRLPGDVQVRLLGSGRERAALAARAAWLRVADRVHLCGWQRRPADFIRGASAVAVPSRDDAWPQTAVQAMGLGVPVVGAAVGGLPELLGDGRGVIVAPDDPAALADALRGVLEGDLRPDLAAARQCAAEFSPARVCQVDADVYRDLTGRPRTA